MITRDLIKMALFDGIKDIKEMRKEERFDWICLLIMNCTAVVLVLPVTLMLDLIASPIYILAYIINKRG